MPLNRPDRLRGSRNSFPLAKCQSRSVSVHAYVRCTSQTTGNARERRQISAVCTVVCVCVYYCGRRATRAFLDLRAAFQPRAIPAVGKKNWPKLFRNSPMNTRHRCVLWLLEMHPRHAVYRRDSQTRLKLRAAPNYHRRLFYAAGSGRNCIA